MYGVGVPIVCVYVCKHVCMNVGVYAYCMHVECLQSLQSAHVSVVFDMPGLKPRPVRKYQYQPGPPKNASNEKWNVEYNYD